MSLKSIRHHAKRHHEAHMRLKDLISKHNPLRENIWTVFFVTFFVVLAGVLIIRNWDYLETTVKNRTLSRKQTIVKTVEPVKNATGQTLKTNGVKTGVKSVYDVERQVSWDYRNLLSSVLTMGGIKAAQANSDFGGAKGIKPADINNILKNSIWVTNYFSAGQHLTKMDQNKTKALTKSVISTYYFGEKTVDINSALQTDSVILSKIKNALSIDLFQYLNQSVNRADSLDGYLNLLKALSNTTDQRINDLQYKIAFLEANAKSKSTEVKTSETSFFNDIKIFDGTEADDELKKFMSLKEDEVEIKAKIGAYKSLYNYYKYYKPKLDTMTKAVQSNRDVLIAGVKVIEIQNMTLPLVTKQK